MSEVMDRSSDVGHDKVRLTEGQKTRRLNERCVLVLRSRVTTRLENKLGVSCGTCSTNNSSLKS